MEQPPTPNLPPRGGNPLRWALAYTRGLIYDQHLRRLTMFYSILGASLMIFVGVTFLDGGWPREHPKPFAVYWLIVGWLTMLAALLAVYDMLMLRLQHRLERRRLREQMLGRHAEGEEAP